MEQLELEWRSRKLPKTSSKQDVAVAARSKMVPGRHSSGSLGHASEPDSGQGLAFMVLDIVEESNGKFHVWGTTISGESTLVRVDDFLPYLYVAAPEKQGSDGAIKTVSEADLEPLKTVWNRSLPSNMRIKSMQLTRRKPIMFYRPEQPEGSAYLKISFPGGSSMKTAGRALHEAKAKVQAAGFKWPHADMHEHEVNSLLRFLVDTSLSSGSWVHIPSAAVQPGGWRPAADRDRVSNCGLEAFASWQHMQALTPDATQMTGWQPPQVDCPAWKEARALAADGSIAPLKLMAVDVQMAPRDGKKRVPVKGADPVVAITSILDGLESVVSDWSGQPGLPEADGQEEGAAASDEGEKTGPSSAAFRELPTTAVASKPASSTSRKVVMLWQPGAQTWQQFDPGPGAEVQVFPSEAEMLQAWHRLHAEFDPDALITFQVRDTLGALAERWNALRVNGGSLHLSRLAPGHSKALAVKRVVQYSPNWVKNQQRMATTSNQETFRADIEGRLVFDVLRHVLTACSLASFSLVDCANLLLGRTLEVLPFDVIASLACLSKEEPHPAAAGAAQQRALRLARYCCARAGVVHALLGRMSSIPETLELARATGLTAGQALYNAQMIRTHSLLLRTAARTGFIIGGRQDVGQLQESPYLMHPIESGTAGLYKQPVAVLDFASLYPSLFRAYNLSYDTLLAAEDATAMPPDTTFTTPTGDAFVKPAVRQGVLPSILAALIEARKATRRLLAEATDPARAAVLDSRQKALKVTANALYGFTGAQASPLQCLPLADSCLALGAASSRRAAGLLAELCDAGKLGPSGHEGRVIYGQTDSIFCLFPNATRQQAVLAAEQAAKLVSDAFLPEMELKFERVCQPFMLLHVNRYAGRAFETAEAAEAGTGTLLVKGLKSMWRQAAPILRTTLQGVLHRILMKEDTAAAVAFVEGEVRRLLEGRCELSEMVMTGGLWRITGQQLERAAKGTGQDDADVRGPHAALAVKLQQRDPGRSFVLGERLQYVLLPGQRLQDEAAEDPLTAALVNAPADWELYWRAKLQRPLKEIFATCLSPAALQELMHGQHTKVRVEQAGVPEVATSRHKGAQQTGLARFYSASAKCLGCRRAIPRKELKGDGTAPGLCSNCRGLEGREAGVHLECLAEANAAAGRQAAALATCARCHSGGQYGGIVCENGECAVFYTRLATRARLESAAKNLSRLDHW